jgi:TonB family protein
MLRMLRIFVRAGLLLCAFCAMGPILDAQEAAVMNGAQAVRFEQGSGFFHYVVFCRTAKQFTAQMPPAKMPPDSLEYGLCWYVNASLSRGNAVSPEVDGQLVISPNHVRFMPRNPQSAETYADLHPDQVELKHDPGQPYGILQSHDLVFRFQFSKLCLTCAPGTPTPAGLASAALLDQEFALLDETIRHFSSGWRQIYRISSGAAPVHVTSRNESASSDTSTAPRPGPAREAAPRPTVAAVANSTAAAISPAPRSPIASQRVKPVRIASGAADGLLLKKVSPTYPIEAKLVRLEGTVVLRAVIDKTGEVSEVYAVSGPPLLESSAVEAVKQWQYRPYSLNGQPVDVETTVQVVFALDGSQTASRAQSFRR